MLKDILDQLKVEHGLQIEDEGERALAIRRVNRAAKEIYDMGDLINFTDEDVFDFDVDEAQVALPEHIGLVRGMRFYDRRNRIPLDNQGNRYGPGIGNEVWPLTNFREKARSPLAYSIDNQSVINFSIPLIEDKDIDIVVQGTTSNSHRFSEKVSIKAGSLTIKTIGNYKMPIHSIRKNRVNNYDVIITDVENNELGVISNCHYNSSYIIYQIYDTPWQGSGGTELAIEVFFKKRFIKFANDDDEFIGGDAYDDAIIWKYLEHRAGKVEDALAFRAKCREVLDALVSDPDKGKRKKMHFVKRPFFNMAHYAYNRLSNS